MHSYYKYARSSTTTRLITMPAHNITNITPVLSGVPFYDVNGKVTHYGVQMMIIEIPSAELLINIPSAALVIATGTNPAGEQMSLLFPNKWVLSSTLCPT